MRFDVNDNMMAAISSTENKKQQFNSHMEEVNEITFVIHYTVGQNASKPGRKSEFSSWCMSIMCSLFETNV